MRHTLFCAAVRTRSTTLLSMRRPKRSVTVGLRSERSALPGSGRSIPPGDRDERAFETYGVPEHRALANMWGPQCRLSWRLAHSPKGYPGSKLLRRARRCGLLLCTEHMLNSL